MKVPLIDTEFVGQNAFQGGVVSLIEVTPVTVHLKYIDDTN